LRERAGGARDMVLNKIFVYIRSDDQ
jgi:hypothetical protein